MAVRLMIGAALVTSFVVATSPTAGAAAAKTKAKSATKACTFDQANLTMTLVADCATSTAIAVPDGWTLDGRQHTITAVDPRGGRFTGAVITSAGTTAHVENVTVVGAIAPRTGADCKTGDEAFRGIYFPNTAGSIQNTRVLNINEGKGSTCAEGDGIVVMRAPLDGSHVSPRAATLVGNRIQGAQNDGIFVWGDLSATIDKNVVEMHAASSPAPDGHDGIRVRQIAAGSSIADNDVVAASRKATIGSGIVADDTLDLVVQDNTVTKSDFGVVLQSLCTAVYADENRLIDNHVTDARDTGVLVLAKVISTTTCNPQVRRTFVSGNVIDGAKVGIGLVAQPGGAFSAVVDATNVSGNHITRATTPFVDGGINTVSTDNATQ
ncbi:MAG TPA: right-handed parallel beta-helix repeat-containing protein [Acidimicrobiia bacterium]